MAMAFDKLHEIVTDPNCLATGNCTECGSIGVIKRWGLSSYFLCLTCGGKRWLR